MDTSVNPNNKAVCRQLGDAIHQPLTFSASPDENLDKYLSVYGGRNLSMKRMSCSEGMLNHVGVAAGHPDALSKSCEDLTAKLEERLRQQREMRREMSRELNKELPETGEFRDMKERQCWRYLNLGKGKSLGFAFQ